jgi:hypothetical protein
MYVCKADDTLQKICQDEYHDVRYERALLAYNRYYQPGNSGIHSDPPVLQAGQQVMLPPQRILEKKYGSLIPNLTPLATPAVRTAPAPVTATSRSSPDTARLYTVPPQGEMVWEIAKRTLGNGDRWQDITQLNPGLDVSRPLPPGTVLKLPAQ